MLLYNTHQYVVCSRLKLGQFYYFWITWSKTEY